MAVGEQKGLRIMMIGSALCVLNIHLQAVYMFPLMCATNQGDTAAATVGF